MGDRPAQIVEVHAAQSDAPQPACARPRGDTPPSPPPPPAPPSVPPPLARPRARARARGRFAESERPRAVAPRARAARDAQAKHALVTMCEAAGNTYFALAARPAREPARARQLGVVAAAAPPAGAPPGGRRRAAQGLDRRRERGRAAAKKECRSASRPPRRRREPPAAGAPPPAPGVADETAGPPRRRRARGGRRLPALHERVPDPRAVLRQVLRVPALPRRGAGAPPAARGRRRRGRGRKPPPPAGCAPGGGGGQDGPVRAREGARPPSGARESLSAASLSRALSPSLLLRYKVREMRSLACGEEQPVGKSCRARRRSARTTAASATSSTPPGRPIYHCPYCNIAASARASARTSTTACAATRRRRGDRAHARVHPARARAAVPALQGGPVPPRHRSRASRAATACTSGACRRTASRWPRAARPPSAPACAAPWTAAPRRSRPSRPFAPGRGPPPTVREQHAAAANCAATFGWFAPRSCWSTAGLSMASTRAAVLCGCFWRVDVWRSGCL